MEKINMSPKMKAIVEEDTLGQWFHGAAMMMTGISVMRAVGALDEEEADDALYRLAAIVRIGAESLGSPANSSLETFIEGARKLQEKAGEHILEIINTAKRRGI